jgi:SpoVK/Ycf46/Vps4 family AAA+-type ATPase
MSEQEEMERYEYALLDVVRLALSGDSRSLVQRTRNLLRGGSNPILSTSARNELRRVLASAAELEPRRGAPVGTRGTPSPGVSPSDLEDANPPILEAGTAARVEELVREHEQRHLLEEANLSPTTRVLLTGPPGNGKTMTARWIARRLGMPLFVIEPGQILSSLMGESARNLSGLLAEATDAPSVVLLDELDAYARDRGDANDIAEPKRLVNTLLLELDRWPDRSLLIAGSNHIEILDVAVRRRFETILFFGPPELAARRQIISDVIGRAHRTLPAEVLDALAVATAGQTGSQLTHTATAALRRSILDEIDAVDAVCQQFLASRFTGRGKVATDSRRRFIRALADAGYPPDRLADLTLSNIETIRSCSERPESI